MSNENEARSFAELIRLLDRGEFTALLDANLIEIREALSDHAQAFGGGKAEASLTLRLDFKFDRGAVAIKSKADSLLPKPPARLYCAVDGAPRICPVRSPATIAVRRSRRNRLRRSSHRPLHHERHDQ